MTVLLDENLPHELRGLLAGHDVYTVQYMKWHGLKNGRLLAQAVAAGFEAFLTIDKGIPYEQNIGQLAIAVVVIDSKSNKIDHLLAFVPRILVALNHATPRSVVQVT